MFFNVSRQKTFFTLENKQKLFKMEPKVAAPAVEFICKCIRLFAFLEEIWSLTENRQSAAPASSWLLALSINNKLKDAQA